jgi:hypothetical protein
LWRTFKEAVVENFNPLKPSGTTCFNNQ